MRNVSLVEMINNAQNNRNAMTKANVSVVQANAKPRSLSAHQSAVIFQKSAFSANKIRIVHLSKFAKPIYAFVRIVAVQVVSVLKIQFKAFVSSANKTKIAMNLSKFANKTNVFASRKNVKQLML